jgi:hypothetical protein
MKSKLTHIADNRHPLTATVYRSRKPARQAAIRSSSMRRWSGETPIFSTSVFDAAGTQG